MFQIVRLMLDANGDIIARRAHAMTMARNETSSLWGDYGYDEEQGCWWASDERGRQYRFVVEEIAQAESRYRTS